MARRYRRRGHRRGSMTIPLAPIAGLLAGLSPAISEGMAGRWDRAIDWITWNYTGYDRPTRTFDAGRMVNGLLPLVTGLMVHKFVGGSPLNLNRTLAAARVPFIRI